MFVSCVCAPQCAARNKVHTPPGVPALAKLNLTNAGVPALVRFNLTGNAGVPALVRFNPTSARARQPNI